LDACLSNDDDRVSVFYSAVGNAIKGIGCFNNEAASFDGDSAVDDRI
jgi:hypothetical protein